MDNGHQQILGKCLSFYCLYTTKI